jgi:hypothetical protein
MTATKNGDDESREVARAPGSRNRKDRISFLPFLFRRPSIGSMLCFLVESINSSLSRPSKAPARSLRRRANQSLGHAGRYQSCEARNGKVWRHAARNPEETKTGKKEKHNKKYNTKPMKGTAAHLETLWGKGSPGRDGDDFRRDGGESFTRRKKM